MEVQFTDDQKAFVRQAIQSGRYTREEDALREALSLWEGRERRRAEILAAVDQAKRLFREAKKHLNSPKRSRSAAWRALPLKETAANGLSSPTGTEAELDGIWFYVATESGSPEIASRLIDIITDRFWLLAKNLQIGRRRDSDLRPGLRSFPVGG